MSKAVGILELSSIAKGMETGDAMLKSANVELLVSKTLCPGKFLLMLGGDVGAVQQAINSGASLAGEMLVDSLVLPNIHPSLLSAISGLNHVEQHRAVGVVETGAIWLLAGLYRLRCVCVPAGAGTARSAANAPQRTERNAAADSCYAGNSGRIRLIKRFTVVNRNDWFR